MPRKDTAMTSRQYKAAVQRLGYTPYGIGKARLLGINVRQSLRYVEVGGVPWPIAIIIELLTKDDKAKKIILDLLEKQEKAK